MYFARGGEGWFYRKSLLIDDGTDRRADKTRVPLDATHSGSIVALDCAPNGDVFVVRINGGVNYLDRYNAPTVATDPPTYGATAATSPLSSLDVQVIGSYVYVLTTFSGGVVESYPLADLSATPTVGGTTGTGTAAGTFENPSRFLTGPKGRVFVKVSIGGNVGVVSFSNLSFADWKYADFNASLP
jgi:hypothetical protein